MPIHHVPPPPGLHLPMNSPVSAPPGLHLPSSPAPQSSKARSTPMSHTSQPAQVASARGASSGASHLPPAARQPIKTKPTNRSLLSQAGPPQMSLALLSPEDEVGCFSADKQDEGEQDATAKPAEEPWEYGKEWSHTLSSQKSASNYADYTYYSTQPTGPSVSTQIETLLRLPPQGVHATLRPSHDSKILLILDSSRQRWVRRREPMRRCLLCMSAWNKRLGCNPSFAIVCAVLNCCLEDSCETFEGAVALFNQYSLGDYFGHAPDSRQQSCMTRSRDCPITTVSQHCFGDRLSQVRRANGITKDIELVWHELEEVWPSIAQVFTQHGSFQLFSTLIEAWLLTLFVESFHPQSQHITEFLPLFHRVVNPVASGIGVIDPRRNLRYIAVCILAAQHHEFMSIASPDALEDLVNGLQYRVVVDATLLNLIDNGVTPRHLAALHVGTLLPLGCAAGWLGGMQAIGMGLLGAATGGALAAAVGVAAAQRNVSSLAASILNAPIEPPREDEDSMRMSSPEAKKLEDSDDIGPSATSGGASSSNQVFR